MSWIINEITASSSATRTRQRAFACIVQPRVLPGAEETRLLWETLFGFEHVKSVAVLSLTHTFCCDDNACGQPP
jgi:hypothetical protein